jgi:hypothetical protein
MGLPCVKLGQEIERISIRHEILVPFYSNSALCCRAPDMRKLASIFAHGRDRKYAPSEMLEHPFRRVCQSLLGQ